MGSIFTVLMLMGIISLGIRIAKNNRQTIERIINKIFNEYE